MQYSKIAIRTVPLTPTAVPQTMELAVEDLSAYTLTDVGFTYSFKDPSLGTAKVFIPYNRIDRIEYYL